MNIDLNSDLGESFGAWRMGDDEAMLEIVNSANVACGFHAGDPASILATLRAAATNRVAVGAHVAYPDLVGFGRRRLDMGSKDLRASILYQISALQGLANVAGTRVRYVKPHGALYNVMARDERQALDVIAAIRVFDPSLTLVVLAGSPLKDWAQLAGLRTVSEAFADRGYQADGSLVPRGRPGAVLHDPEAVAARMVQLVRQGTVTAEDGSLVAVRSDTICVHGDSPDAVLMACHLRQRLLAEGIVLRSFVDLEEA